MTTIKLSNLNFKVFLLHENSGRKNFKCRSSSWVSNIKTNFYLNDELHHWARKVSAFSDDIFCISANAGWNCCIIIVFIDFISERSLRKSTKVKKNILAFKMSIAFFSLLRTGCYDKLYTVYTSPVDGQEFIVEEKNDSAFLSIRSN